MRHRRPNPPLAQHLAEESLSDLSLGLGPRLADDPSEGAEFVRDLLRAVAGGLGEYENKREIGEHLHEAYRHLNAALAYMHPRRNPREPSREYKAGAAAYRRLDRRAKGELGDQLVEGSFDWMDWFSDRPHPDFLRGFKDSWNPEDE